MCRWLKKDSKILLTLLINKFFGIVEIKISYKTSNKFWLVTIGYDKLKHVGLFNIIYQRIAGFLFVLDIWNHKLVSWIFRFAIIFSCGNEVWEVFEQDIQETVHSNSSYGGSCAYYTNGAGGQWHLIVYQNWLYVSMIQSGLLLKI